LALQNKAIRSGVPIGPFQTKRKRKSMRLSLEAASGGTNGPPAASASRARKQARVASLSGSSSSAGILTTAAKKGDLEVRKDLTIESQRTEIIFFATTDRTADNSTANIKSSSSSASEVITRAKVSERNSANLSTPVPVCTGTVILL
jgi:hypothetical protein